MNIIYLLDKTKAEYLKKLGFKYKEKIIDNKTTYEFYGTDDLLNELNSKFDKSSFFVRKNLCF